MSFSSLYRFLLKVHRKESYFLQPVLWKLCSLNLPYRNFLSGRANGIPMDLSSVVHALKRIAPLELAEEWDNVGLLIEPTQKKEVSHIMLTVDLTEAVVGEAIKCGVDMIVAYHPPIFKPLKNLLCDNWKASIILKCIEAHIAVYSPHTALDAIKGGINDGLLQCFDCGASVPIINKNISPKYTHSIKFECLPEHKKLPEFLPNVEIVDYSSIQEGFMAGTIRANEADIDAIKMLALNVGDFKISGITREMDSPPSTLCGAGRRALLASPIKISEAVEKIKHHLNLDQVRVSLAAGCTLESVVQSVAVCAGSGAEVLLNTKADLFITGEMSHHQLLDAAHKGSTVILAEHSNSERFFLPQLAAIIMRNLPEVRVTCSELDKDPVVFM